MTTTIALTGGLLLTLPSGAVAAPPTDYAFAVADTTLAQAEAVALVARYNTENPDITCPNPVVAGTVVTPALAFPVGETYGSDLAAGAGLCMSFQEPFTATLVLYVQWMDASRTWHNLCRSLPFTMDSVHGVATPAIYHYPCAYDVVDAPAGRPHRVYGELTNSKTSRVYPGLSHVFLTPDEDMGHL